MDPFRVLPEEVFDKIFVHFNAKDFFQASLVSKHWYRTTGRSKECMRKIKAYYFSFLQKNDVKCYLKSERNYHHLTIVHERNNQDAKVMRNIRSIVNKFSGSLITLKSHADISRASELPKLKQLIICCYANQMKHHCVEQTGLIAKAKYLEELIIQCDDICKSSIKAVHQNIVNIQSLKILKIADAYLLDSLSTSGNLKLEEFHLIRRYDDWIPSFYDFFDTQRPYLKIVDCNMGFGQIAFFMENFPLLEKLIVRNEAFEEDEMSALMQMDTLEYPYNKSIHTFGYDGFIFDGETYNVITILQKLKNLQKLQLNFIDPVLTATILGLKSLKTVEYCEIDDLDDTASERVQEDIRVAKCEFIQVEKF